MKNNLFILFLFASIASYSQQKQQRQEIYISAGMGTLPFISQSLSHLDFGFGSGLLPPELQAPEEKSKDNVFPVITIGYQNKVSKKIKLGIEFIYDRFLISNKENRYRYNSFLGRFDYLWKEYKKFVLYSGISAGVITGKIWEDNGNINKKVVYPAGHLYILCFDFKLRNLLITLNYGAGVSGFLNTGLKYKFR